MHFRSVFELLFLCLGVAFADTKPFILQTLISGNPTIWKGNPLEFAPVFDDTVQLYSSKDYKPRPLIIDDASHLKLTNGMLIQVKEWGYLFLVNNTARATPGFSLRNGYLYFNNQEGFYAIPDGTRYIISTKDPNAGPGTNNSTDDTVGIVIKHV